MTETFKGPGDRPFDFVGCCHAGGEWQLLKMRDETRPKSCADRTNRIGDERLTGNPQGYKALVESFIGG